MRPGTTREALHSTLSYGLDSDSRLLILDQRIAELEERLQSQRADIGDRNSSHQELHDLLNFKSSRNRDIQPSYLSSSRTQFHDHNRKPNKSIKSAHSQYQCDKLPADDESDLRLTIDEMNLKLQAFSDDVRGIQLILRDQTSANHRQQLTGIASNADIIGPVVTGLQADVKDLKRKIKRLADESSSQWHAMHLTTSSLQESYENTKDWGDHVHSCFGVISDRLQLSSNICVRMH